MELGDSLELTCIIIIKCMLTKENKMPGEHVHQSANVFSKMKIC